MHKSFLPGLILFAVGALVSLHAQTPAAPAAPADSMQPGQIIAAKVTGSVTMSVNGAAAVKLNNNDPVPEHATVNTEDDASVVLVFSNGATTQLGAGTQLVIDQFLQDPFSAAIKVADLDGEPTRSRTKLKLTHGELVGNVKHLKHDQGSTFVVDTPVGAAGIRGTTFRIVFRPNGTGLAFFSLSTVEGNVNFQNPGANGGGTGGTGTGTGGGTDPNGGGGTAGGGTAGGTGGTAGGTGTSGGTGGLAVTGGQEVVVTINVTTNPTTGVVTLSAPVVVANTTNISAATLQAVTQQAVAIVTTASAVTFTPTLPAGGTGSGTGGTGTGGTGTGGTGTGGTGGTGTGDTGAGTGSGGSSPSGNNSGTGTGSGGSGTGSSTNFTTTNKPPTATSSTPVLTSGDGRSG